MTYMYLVSPHLPFILQRPTLRLLNPTSILLAKDSFCLSFMQDTRRTYPPTYSIQTLHSKKIQGPSSVTHPQIRLFRQGPYTDIFPARPNYYVKTTREKGRGQGCGG